MIGVKEFVLLTLGKKYRGGQHWAGLDSNQRRLTPMGLQPIPFSLSGTDPDL